MKNSNSFFQFPNRKGSSQICPVTLSEISESGTGEGQVTGQEGDPKLGYEGLNEVIKEIDIDGEFYLALEDSNKLRCDQVQDCWNLLREVH